MRFLPGAAVLLILPTCAAAQSSKPSPIVPKRAQRAAYVPPPSAPEKTESGKPGKTAPPATGNVGTACFYRPKPAVQPDGSAEPPPAPEFTAAHSSFPVGTRVRVTNLANKKTTTVTVTDHSNPSEYIISVSIAAADQLGFTRMGTAQVSLEKLN